MKKNVKLSIVIPIYNAEKYLKKCIESIISNKDTEIEVILINDGSKDESNNICREYLFKDNRITYFNRENNGCSATRNFGIQKAKGEYVWFIDSDDYIEKDSIEKILKILGEKKSELLIFGYFNVRNGKVLEKIIPKKIDTKLEVYSQMEIFNSPWNKVYNLKLLKENNIFFPEDCHMGEDMAFNFKYLYFCKKISIIEEGFYNYVATGGVTSNINKKKEIFLAFDNIYKFYIQKKDFVKLKDILKEYYKKHAIFYSYEMILTSNLSKKEKLKKLKEFNIELNKRKYMFNTRFLHKQIYYYLKYKFYFLKPCYKKIKKYFF